MRRVPGNYPERVLHAAFALAPVLAHGGDMATAVRTGAAAGALNVTRHGLGTGHIDAVQVLTERVQLTPIEKA